MLSALPPIATDAQTSRIGSSGPAAGVLVIHGDDRVAVLVEVGARAISSIRGDCLCERFVRRRFGKVIIGADIDIAVMRGNDVGRHREAGTDPDAV